jgi:hypothetical protein
MKAYNAFLHSAQRVFFPLALCGVGIIFQQKKPTKQKKKKY